MMKAIYTKVEQLLSIGNRNTEHVVDYLTHLEGKLDVAVPVKSETSSAVDAKAAVAFVETGVKSATVWPNFGHHEDFSAYF